MEILHSKLTILANRNIILKDFMQVWHYFTMSQLCQYLLFNQMLHDGPIDLNTFVLTSGYETFRMLWAEDLQCLQQFLEFDMITNTTIVHGLPLPQGFFDPPAKPQDEEWDGLTCEQITMATNLAWYVAKELELQQAAKARNYTLHEERCHEKKLACAHTDSDDVSLHIPKVSQHTQAAATMLPIMVRMTPMVTSPVTLNGLLDPPEELPEVTATASTAVVPASIIHPTHLLDDRFTKEHSTKGKAPMDAPKP
ncbi:hypothetical protein WOLCODRAFT_147380 [Wolfiporia cocos MD-104 SS10]|uniref:Uncharacterized protein n=1 Tax=Wolfiporia cocos (strain MD-104) TaxID=742152 RepID=A0A2H3ITH6_WOLCO|nr:hypothetical protein WOLCODRAFT_147380 [Wolfiporia cocos MD-104 SS10]